MLNDKQHRDQRLSASDRPKSPLGQESLPVAAQKRIITEFANKKGWQIAHWYEEAAHSMKGDE